MARTVVYENPLLAAHYADEVAADPAHTRSARRTARTNARRKAANAEQPSTAGKVALAKAPTRDGYLTKIGKYVPAETITVATLAFLAFEPEGDTIWIYVAIGAVVNAIYLLSVALVSSAPLPRWFFYVLAAAAFVLWAMAVIDPVTREAGVTGENVESQKTAILAMAAFLLPALDTILDYIDVRFRAPPAKVART